MPNHQASMIATPPTPPRRPSRLDHVKAVNAYYAALERSDAGAVAELFTQKCATSDANRVSRVGPGGVLAMCQELFACTSSRTFRVVTIADAGPTVMVRWFATLKFRKGATLGWTTLGSSFEMTQEGVTVFEFDRQSGLIRESHTFHETSRAGELAREHAQLVYQWKLELPETPD